MSENEVAELVEPTFDDGASTDANPVETAPEITTTDAGASEANPIASEQDDPSSLKSDQPTTKEPVDPLPEVLSERPAAPAPTGLPPELDVIAKDPQQLKQLWERHTNLQKLNGQQSNELGQLRKVASQWEGMDRRQVDQLLQQQQQAAKQANLNPWNRDHPENRSFAQVRERRRIDDLRLSRVAPEQREEVRRALDADYTPEELNSLKGYEQYRRQEDMLTPEDREDRYREMARAESRNEIQRLLQYQEQTRATQDFLTKNPDLITKDQELLARALDERTPRSQLAAEIAALKAQVSQLAGQRGKDLRVVETARAQTANSQRAAVIGRDSGQPRRKGDPVAAALKAAESDPNFDAFDMLVRSQSPSDPNE